MKKCNNSTSGPSASRLKQRSEMLEQKKVRKFGWDKLPIEEKRKDLMMAYAIRNLKEIRKKAAKKRL